MSDSFFSRYRGGLLLASVGAVLGLVAPACDNLDNLTGEPCDVDADCNDGDFCNGRELCQGAVCVRFGEVDCNDGVDCTEDSCDEVRDVCRNVPPDEDGDGSFDAACVSADGVPLGADCDDSDPDRFTGNVERCDPDHHDEDCDPSTFGFTDADEDGAIAAACCNEGSDGLLCGNDCDDEDPGALPGAQVCDPETDDGNDVLICRLDGTWTTSKCFDEQLCVTQPNGRGVCVP